MSEKILSLVGFLLLFLLATSVPAKEIQASSTAATDLDGLQRTYAKLASLVFDFSQSTRTAVRARQGNGTALFLRIRDKSSKSAGIMRWNYEAPEKQVILNNGKELSIYTENGHQLLVMPAADVNDDIIYSLFSGTRRLADLFETRPPDPRFSFSLPGTDLKILHLVPRKPHPQVKSIQIWHDDAFLIRHMVIEDHFDTITEMDFTNIRINTIDPADPKQFSEISRLDLPDDVEIIHQ